MLLLLLRRVGVPVLMSGRTPTSDGRGGNSGTDRDEQATGKGNDKRIHDNTTRRTRGHAQMSCTGLTAGTAKRPAKWCEAETRRRNGGGELQPCTGCQTLTGHTAT